MSSAQSISITQYMRREAFKDQEFVENLCRRRKVPWITFSEDVKGIAEKQSMSLEEAGRMIRYRVS